jgi:hypothetical protein
MSGLRLDRREAAIAGGYSGPVILAGNSGASRLIQMVTVGRNGKVMPPVGPRLNAAEVDVLRRWIDQGAEWPDDGPNQSAGRSSHWAFRHIQRPSVPAVKDVGWMRNPIDAFILARLRRMASRLRPKPIAERSFAGLAWTSRAFLHRARRLPISCPTPARTLTNGW